MATPLESEVAILLRRRAVMSEDEVGLHHITEIKPFDQNRFAINAYREGIRTLGFYQMICAKVVPAGDFVDPIYTSAR